MIGAVWKGASMCHLGLQQLGVPWLSSWWWFLGDPRPQHNQRLCRESAHTKLCRALFSWKKIMPLDGNSQKVLSATNYSSNFHDPINIMITSNRFSLGWTLNVHQILFPPIVYQEYANEQRILYLENNFMQCLHLKCCGIAISIYHSSLYFEYRTTTSTDLISEWPIIQKRKYQEELLKFISYQVSGICCYQVARLHLHVEYFEVKLWCRDRWLL